MAGSLCGRHVQHRIGTANRYSGAGKFLARRFVDHTDFAAGLYVVELCSHRNRGGIALTAAGQSSRWKRLINVLVLLPWALPGTVVAVSVAEAYGQPNNLTGSFILVGTFWILPVVYFLRFMPLVVRAVQASIEQLDRALEEAAAVLGANWWRRFWRVRLPLVAPGALAGTLLAFVIGLGEYVASVLVFTPSNRPVSIAIASAMRDFSLGTAAAYGVILIALIAIAMVVAGQLQNREQ